MINNKMEDKKIMTQEERMELINEIKELLDIQEDCENVNDSDFMKIVMGVLEKESLDIMSNDEDKPHP